MQNQPGPGPRKHDPADARHDRQAARVKEDAFKGGSPARSQRVFGWLRNPWTPVAGRLWPGRNERES